MNRSKQSIALDLDDAKDLDLAQELCRRADVVVENFRSGALDRRGLGYDQVRRDNPDVVYCSVTAFGDGAGASLSGYDFVVQAVGELMSITGPRDGEPHKAGVALVDVLTGKDAVAAILAALLHPQRTGEGQRVSVDLMSSLLSALVNQASATLTTGESPSRMGNRHPSIAPYEALRCRDALLAVAVGNDAQFRVFMDVLGAPAIADDERFASNAQRVAHREELVALLEGCLARRDAADWEAELISVGIACGRINDVAGAMSYAERLGLAPLVPMPDGRVPQVRSPLILRGTGLAASVAPPSLGQHDQLVRARLRRSAPEGDQEPSPTLEGEDAS